MMGKSLPSQMQDIYDEVAKLDFSSIVYPRRAGKSSVLTAGYGAANTGRTPPQPDPNALARRVACPACKAPKDTPCIRVYPASKNPRRRRMRKLWAAHEARIARAALICEELTG
ncbi:hypothetical protein [Methylobacterium sp. 285MFTsu5.1]|uniref:zinc finger domain-containing protein n=1 Tax=Methylobacterium sp. 285MFTsu5.1 TaxID=1172187 RepID=UPI00037C8EA8|nr:hypothetical protein [Methylobacterium sp. 285MFTsu5.1]